MLNFLIKCLSCNGQISHGLRSICSRCEASLVVCPRLCSECGSPRCPVAGDCKRIWVSKINQESGQIDSYSAQYLMIGHGYTVLKKWKLHRGPLFDRQILRLSLKQLDCLQKFEAEAIVPIPRQFHRSWKMRGNPAEIVARRLAKHLKLPLKDILTLAPLGELQKQQAQSSLGERLLNRESRFCTQSPLDPPPNRLILVDDFMTTGRTLNEAAKVLRRFGTQRIHAHILGVRALLSSSISNSNSNSNGSKYNQFN